MFLSMLEIRILIKFGKWSTKNTAIFVCDNIMIELEEFYKKLQG